MAFPSDVCCAAERPHTTGFFLEVGEPDPLAFALTAAGVQPGFKSSAEVDGGFLEYLLAHLGTPGQTRHHRIGGALSVDSEDPAGVLGFLPGVERVDQIKPGPRHIYSRICPAVGERGLHHPKALVERKP